MQRTALPAAREFHRFRILRHIRAVGPVSRAELARVSQINPATISALVAGLVERGLVREVGLGSSRGGRRPKLVELTPSGLHFVGVDFGIRTMVGVLTNLAGDVVAERETAVAAPHIVEQVLGTVESTVRSLLQDAGLERDELVGVGLSIPGIWAPGQGVLFLPNAAGWNGLDVEALLEDRLGLPVRVENDGNACALGEKWFGKGDPYASFVHVMVDDGVGAGIMLPDGLLMGQGRGAAEFGHLPVSTGGPTCNCGRQGCLETVGSYAAYRRYRKEGMDEAGALDRCAGHLAQAMAVVINLLVPQCIFLGGPMIRDFQNLWAEVARRAHELSVPVLAQQVRIMPSTLGERTAALGAVGILMEDVFAQGELARRSSTRTPG